MTINEKRKLINYLKQQSDYFTPCQKIFLKTFAVRLGKQFGE